MAIVLKPTVWQMIVCDDVLSDARWPRKPVIVGPICLIRKPVASDEPFTLHQLCIWFALTDGYGAGQARFSCWDEERQREIFSSPERTLSFKGKDPSGLYGVTCRLTKCKFPHAGVYVIRFQFESEELDRRRILVR
jgi:hypothetical protein